MTTRLQSVAAGMRVAQACCRLVMKGSGGQTRWTDTVDSRVDVVLQVQ